MVKRSIQYETGDEINLDFFYRSLLQSKKLIILGTLIFTLAGFLLNTQIKEKYRSEIIVEIGQYEDNKLIESTANLIQNILIKFIYQGDVSSDSLFIEKIQNRLISIEYSSYSKNENIQILDAIAQFINSSHTNIINANNNKSINPINRAIQKINGQIKFTEDKIIATIQTQKEIINNSIIDLNRRINFSKETISNNNKFQRLFIEKEKEANILQISNDIDILEQTIPAINQKLIALKKIIEDDENNLLLLKSKPDLFLNRAAQSPTLNEIIFNYKEKYINLESDLISTNENIKILKSQLEFERTFNLTQHKILLENQLGDPSSTLNNNVALLLFELIENKNRQKNKDDALLLFELYEKMYKLESQLKNVDNDVLMKNYGLMDNADISLFQYLFDLKQKRNTLELELTSKKEINYSFTKLIGEVNTNINDVKKQLVIFLSFLIGLVASISIALIANALKNNKSQEV